MTTVKVGIGVALVLAATLEGMCWGQQSAQPRAVSLEEVLSCEDDPFVASIFELTEEAVGKLIPQAKTYDPKVVKAYGFWIAASSTVGRSDLIIMPKDQNNSFCRYYPTVSGFAVPKNDTTYHPVLNIRCWRRTGIRPERSVRSC
jgi:hypothetical protein